MLKKILVAVAAGIIIAAILIPALAGNLRLANITSKQKAEPTAITNLHPVHLTK